jgi:excisionase family DNA binding protein
MQKTKKSRQNSHNMLPIGKAAKRIGVSVDTLRRWEKQGRIISYRSPGKHRYFKIADLERLHDAKYQRSKSSKKSKKRDFPKPRVTEKSYSPFQYHNDLYNTPSIFSSSRENSYQQTNPPRENNQVSDFVKTGQKKINHVETKSTVTKKRSPRIYLFCSFVFFILLDVILVFFYLGSSSAMAKLP